MSLAKAEDLQQIIIEIMPRWRPEIKAISDGHEWVIMLCNGKYVWNFQDWFDNFAPKEPEMIQEKVEVEA